MTNTKPSQANVSFYLLAKADLSLQDLIAAPATMKCMLDSGESRDLPKAKRLLKIIATALDHLHSTMEEALHALGVLNEVQRYIISEKAKTKQQIKMDQATVLPEKGRNLLK